jgi:mannose-1-phosphate guanylyltransferase/mannose-6-phosphate isomerase
MTSPKIVPLVMAGGAGTRLWPLSRDTLPKQFIPLLGDGRSTFQATLQRLDDPRFDTPIIITNNDFRFIAAEQMLAVGIKGEIVLEPERRDSAAAVAVGTVLAVQRDAEAVCAAFAADHVVLDTEAFRADCAIAAELAASGLIMTLGIPPTHPATGYGYLARGEALPAERASRLLRFVEKPDRARAERYLEEGYLWNSGNFLFSAALMHEELSRHAPEVLEAAIAAVAGATRDLDFLRLDPVAFGKANKISIDYAVMERTEAAGVVAASFDWSDIGAWDSIHEIKPKDSDRNVIEGNAVTLDAHGVYVRSDDLLTTIVGLDDIVVVATRDAVLVSSMAAAGKVKTLVEAMKARGAAGGERAPEDLPALGLVSAHRYRPALPGEAHQCEARRAAQPAEAFPSRRALGRGFGHGRGHGRRQGQHRARE